MNRVFKASMLFIVFVAFQAQSSAQTLNAPALSDDDKAAIITSVLNLWFSRARELPPAQGEGLLKFDTLSTEYMSATLVSKLVGLKLTLRTSRQLKKLGRQSTPVRFFQVSIMPAGKSIGVAVIVSSKINGATEKHSYHYLFERIDGQWQGKATYIIC